MPHIVKKIKGGTLHCRLKRRGFTVLLGKSALDAAWGMGFIPERFIDSETNSPSHCRRRLLNIIAQGILITGEKDTVRAFSLDQKTSFAALARRVG